MEDKAGKNSRASASPVKYMPELILTTFHFQTEIKFLINNNFCVDDSYFIPGRLVCLFNFRFCGNSEI